MTPFEFLLTVILVLIGFTFVLVMIALTVDWLVRDAERPDDSAVDVSKGDLGPAFHFDGSWRRAGRGR